jgi:MFS family permease
LIIAMGLLYVVTLLLVPLETRSAHDGLHRMPSRMQYGLNLLLRFAQGLLGTILGLAGGLVVTDASGLSEDVKVVSLWLATLLLALIVALPYLSSQLARRRATEGTIDAAIPPVGATAATTVLLPEAVAGAPAHNLAVAPTLDVPGPAAATSTLPGAMSTATLPTELLDVPVAARPRDHLTIAQIVVLAAFCLDLLLYSLVVPFLPSEAQGLGATPVATGVLFAMYAAGIFAATPLAAWLSDSSGPRSTLLWGLVTLGGATLLFAFSPTLRLGLLGLFAARAAQGAASALTWTAGLAVLAQLHTAEERRRAFARAFAVTGLGALIGPPLGGVLYAWGGFMLPFLVATGLVALDGLGRLLFLPDNAVLPAPRPAPGSGHALWHDSRVWMGLVGALAGAWALSSLEPGTPLLLGHTFGMPVWSVGVVFGGLALCFLLIQPLVSSSERRVGTAPTIALGLFLTAGCFVATAGAAGAAEAWWDSVARSMSGLALLPPLPASLPIPPAPPVTGVLAALTVAGCALALALTPVPELLGHRAEILAGEHGPAYGAIYAAYNAAYGLGVLLGPLVTGAAIAAQGVAGSFFLLAFAPALGAVILLVWHTRARTSTPEREPPATTVSHHLDGGTRESSSAHQAHASAEAH